MIENFLNFLEKIDTQVQEAQRVPNKMNLKRPRDIIAKNAKG